MVKLPNLGKHFFFSGRTGSVDYISNMLDNTCISHDPALPSMFASPPVIMLAPLDFCFP